MSAPQGALQFVVAGHLGNLSQLAVPFPVRGGFASSRFNAETVEVALHAHDGVRLHSALPIHRRKLDETRVGSTSMCAQADASSSKENDVIRTIVWLLMFLLIFRAVDAQGKTALVALLFVSRWCVSEMEQSPLIG